MYREGKPKLTSRYLLASQAISISEVGRVARTCLQLSNCYLQHNLPFLYSYVYIMVAEVAGADERSKCCSPLSIGFRLENYNQNG